VSGVKPKYNSLSEWEGKGEVGEREGGREGGRGERERERT
jgi:hypothetical protein